MLLNSLRNWVKGSDAGGLSHQSMNSLERKVVCGRSNCFFPSQL